MKRNEKLLLGVDLIKSKDIVLPAYNDAGGITRDFNLNLLKRINRELGADFNLENFEHAPEYTEVEGIAKSFLKSKKEQIVHIHELNKSFEFAENELIQTEISRKYNDEILDDLLKKLNVREILPGLILSIFIAYISLFLGKFVPSLGAASLSIFIGIC